jgi:hypothetical protein
LDFAGIFSAMHVALHVACAASVCAACKAHVLPHMPTIITMSFSHSVAASLPHALLASTLLANALGLMST